MNSNNLGCPIFSLSAPVLYWLSHLTCISRLKAKNERKTLIYTQLKICRYNQHFFAIFRRIPYKLTSDLFTVVWHVHTLPHFFLATISLFLTLEWFLTTEWPVLWMCVPYLQRYGPFKNGPSVRGSRGGASLFTDKHEVRATLSSVDLNSHFIYTHETTEYILSIKYKKRFAEIENLDLLRFGVLPVPPKACIFPPRRQSYHSWWENMMVKNGIEIKLTSMTVLKETVNG